MSDLVALVTGASSGIGAGIAKLFLSKGWKVIMIARSEDKMSRIANEYPYAKAQIIKFDLFETQKVKDILIPLIKTTNKKIDVIINNAGGGMGEPGSLNNISLKAWYNYIDIHLTIPFIFCDYLINELKQSKYPATIINIGSIWGNQPQNKHMAYTIAKRGIKSLTENYALGYGKYGIRVNNIEPGYTITPGLDRMLLSADKVTPLKRKGTVDDIVKLVDFLQDPVKSSFITGSHYKIDGGVTLNRWHSKL
eukprot:491289_1